MKYAPLSTEAYDRDHIGGQLTSSTNRVTKENPMLTRRQLFHTGLVTCRSRKSQPARIRARRQNQRIILSDVRIPSAAWERLLPACSGRGTGLKSRTSFSGISSILL
jgi:hypothetical protein